MIRFTPARLQLLLLILCCSLAPVAHARGGSGGQEDQVMVSNGQGVSSPSFWGGLSGQNPAGLTRNTSLKLQGGGSADSGASAVRPAAGILIGNGLLGAGLEYARHSSNSQLSDTSQIDWGIAGNFSALSIGVSGHHLATSNGGFYDFGALFQLGQSLRLGVLIPDFTNGLKVVGGGLTYTANSSIDLVIDASGNVTGGNPHLMLKPGVTVRLSNVQLTAAYGFGSNSGIDVVNKDFSGGIGIRLARAFLLEYEYQVESTHRLGLTLKLD